MSDTVDTLVESKKSLASIDYISLEDQYGAHNYHPLDIVISKANGVWVEDVDGNIILKEIKENSKQKWKLKVQKRQRE